jgi:hypothetical protein
MLKQEAKAKWRFNLNSFRFSARARPVKESKSSHCGRAKVNRAFGRRLFKTGEKTDEDQRFEVIRRRCRGDHECIAAVPNLWFGGIGNSLIAARPARDIAPRCSGLPWRLVRT